MKPYIICHMMASIDGRIDCTMTSQMRGVDEYYDTLSQLDVPTTISGRVTAVMKLPVDGEFQPKTSQKVGRETYHIASKAKGYSVVTDTRGTLRWQDNIVDGKPLLILMSEDAAEDYLNYLEQNGISYVVAGAGHIDLARASEILAEQFGVERMATVGGGKINGGFLNANLTDEVSLLLGPGIDGRTSQPSVFEGIDEAHTRPYQLKLNSVKAYDDGAIWIRYQIEK